MADGDTEVGVIFPTKGIETTCEFGRQPVDTTPSGINVRTYEQFLQRARGGSRTGLTQYIPAQVFGNHPVQHLNVLVDPQGIGLDAPVGSTVPYPTMLDPSSNNLAPSSGGLPRNFGRFVRIGGGGNQPNRNDPRRSKQLEFVQAIAGKFTFNASPNLTISFNNRPSANNLIILAVSTFAANPDTGPFRVGGIQNSGANAFSQIGGGGYFSEMSSFADGSGTVSNYYSMSMWYRVANAGSPDQTIVITSPSSIPSVNETVFMQALEYRNNGFGPLDQFARNSNGQTSSSLPLGPVLLSNIFGEAVVCALTTFPVLLNPDHTPGGGSDGFPLSYNNSFVPRTGFPQSVATADTTMFDRTGLQLTTLSTSITATNPTGYISMMASFKPG